jgi:HPt (histidine-containing phosphotransfer) domain-containing protein
MKKCCETYLNSQFGGDAGIVGEIYAEYVSSMSAKLAEAEAALAAADWALLDRVAHTVKGNALSAGDPETADVAIALRNATKLADAAASAMLLSRLKTLAAGL